MKTYSIPRTDLHDQPLRFVGVLLGEGKAVDRPDSYHLKLYETDDGDYVLDVTYKQVGGDTHRWAGRCAPTDVFDLTYEYKQQWGNAGGQLLWTSWVAMSNALPQPHRDFVLHIGLRESESTGPSKLRTARDQMTKAKERLKRKCPKCGSIGWLAGEERPTDFEHGPPVIFIPQTTQNVGQSEDLKPIDLDILLTCSMCNRSFPFSTLAPAYPDARVTVIQKKKQE